MEQYSKQSSRERFPIQCMGNRFFSSKIKEHGTSVMKQMAPCFSDNRLNNSGLYNEKRKTLFCGNERSFWFPTIQRENVLNLYETNILTNDQTIYVKNKNKLT